MLSDGWRNKTSNIPLASLRKKYFRFTFFLQLYTGEESPRPKNSQCGLFI